MVFLVVGTPLGDAKTTFGDGMTLKKEQATFLGTKEDAALHLAAVIESSSDAIITKSLDGIIRTWNPSAEKIFGYSAAEVVGKPVTILFPPDHVNEEPQILARIQRGEKIDHYETVRLTKDGRRIAIALTVSPIKNADGIIVGASKIARDITELKRSEEIANHMAAVVTSSSDAIITKTLGGIITSWNPSAQRIFGYEAHEMIGKSVTLLIPEDHINEEPEIIGRIRRGERVDHYETVRRTKHGRIIPISLTVSPIRDKNGTIVGASKIVRDISPQKAYEQHLIAQATELEQFAYVASHDLREPLRKVAVYTELLVSRFQSAAGPDAAKYVRNITDAVARMQKLISDLLSYSRADGSDTGLEAVDLKETVKEVLESLEVPIRESGAQVSIGEIPRVMANRFQMHQLLQNLISNAVKFRGDAVPVVTVSSIEEAGNVVVSVTDNGIGIEPQYRDRVFRIFQRLHSVDRYPGTGIGLAICKKIVERHGGKIWLQPSPGTGTTFSFSLPKS